MENRRGKQMCCPKHSPSTFSVGRGRGRGRHNINHNERDEKDYNKHLFESQSGTWTIIGVDGKCFKFHPDVMAERVPHFRRMLSHEGFLEQVKQEVRVPAELQLTGAGLDSFLRFVYYEDRSGMQSSFDVTSSTIRAGHFYDFPELIQVSMEVIKENRRNLDWFCEVELGLLWKFVWLWQDDHTCKNDLLIYLARIIKVLLRYKDSDILKEVLNEETDDGAHLLRELTLSEGDLPDFAKEHNICGFTRRGRRVYSDRASLESAKSDMRSWSSIESEESQDSDELPPCLTDDTYNLMYPSTDGYYCCKL